MFHGNDKLLSFLPLFLALYGSLNYLQAAPGNKSGASSEAPTRVKSRGPEPRNSSTKAPHFKRANLDEPREAVRTGRESPADFKRKAATAAHKPPQAGRHRAPREG